MNYSRQRNLVYDIVKASYDHPTAEEVYQEAQKIQPSIGIATVYRNLNQLASAGEINRIAMKDGTDRFDGHLEEHYHMVCRQCGRLQDLRTNTKDMDRLKNLAEKTFGLKVSNQAALSATILEGICDQCRKLKKVV